MLNRMFTYIASKPARRIRGVAVVTSGALFAGLMVTIGAVPSVAQAIDPTVLCGMCLTEPAITAVSITGSSKVTVNGGGIYANSNAAPAVTVTGSSKIVTNAQVRAAGTILKTGSSTISGSPASGLTAPLFADPYPGRALVVSVGPNNATTDYSQSTSGLIPARADATYRDVTLNGSGTFTFPDAHRYRDITIGGSVTATLKPGRYRNITLGGSSKITLSPGTYWLAGNLNVTSSSKVTGTDSSLVLACATASNDTRACNNETGGRLIVTGSSQLTLNGNTPTTPAIRLLPGNTADITVDGSSKLVLANSGIDAPKASLLATGSSSINTAGVIHIGRVSVTGSSTVTATVIPAPPATTTTTAAASTTTSTTSTTSLPTSTTTTLPATTTSTTPAATTTTSTTSTITTSTTTTTSPVTNSGPSGPSGLPLLSGFNSENADDICPPGALQGSAGDDILTGTAVDDLICGLGGNDRIDGMGGNDRIWGGLGNDQIDGGDGIDSVYGGSGNDALSGGSGNDQISGGAGTDSLNGGAGTDDLDGGVGVDSADGGSDSPDSCSRSELTQSCEQRTLLGATSPDETITVVAGSASLTVTGPDLQAVDVQVLAGTTPVEFLSEAAGQTLDLSLSMGRSFSSATLTLPIPPEIALADVGVFSIDNGFVEQDQTLSTNASTHSITVALRHFSPHTPVRLSSMYTVNNPPASRCLSTGSSVSNYVLLDTSGSMAALGRSPGFADQLSTLFDSSPLGSESRLLTFDGQSRQYSSHRDLAITQIYSEAQSGFGSTSLEVALSGLVDAAASSIRPVRVATLVTDSEAFETANVTLVGQEIEKLRSAHIQLNLEVVGSVPLVYSLMAVATGGLVFQGSTSEFGINVALLTSSLFATEKPLDTDGISNCDERTGVPVLSGGSIELLSGLDQQKKDSDKDGLVDSLELRIGVSPASKSLSKKLGRPVYSRYSNPSKIDTDGDGLIDSMELSFELNPRVPDRILAQYEFLRPGDVQTMGGFTRDDLVARLNQFDGLWKPEYKKASLEGLYGLLVITCLRARDMVGAQESAVSDSNLAAPFTEQSLRGQRQTYKDHQVWFNTLLNVVPALYPRLETLSVIALVAKYVLAGALAFALIVSTAGIAAGYVTTMAAGTADGALVFIPGIGFLKATAVFDAVFSISATLFAVRPELIDDVQSIMFQGEYANGVLLANLYKAIGEGSMVPYLGQPLIPVKEGLGTAGFSVTDSAITTFNPFSPIVAETLPASFSLSESGIPIVPVPVPIPGVGNAYLPAVWRGPPNLFGETKLLLVESAGNVDQQLAAIAEYQLKVFASNFKRLTGIEPWPGNMGGVAGSESLVQLKLVAQTVVKKGYALSGDFVTLNDGTEFAKLGLPGTNLNPATYDIRASSPFKIDDKRFWKDGVVDLPGAVYIDGGDRVILGSTVTYCVESLNLFAVRALIAAVPEFNSPGGGTQFSFGIRNALVKGFLKIKSIGNGTSNC
jgi:RTX calcium-binding nonapeptide repeat (4 copies)